MNATNLTATATTAVRADRHQVWQALIDPLAIKEYMYGTTVESDWQPGSVITWSGEWQGKRYQDKGQILEVVPERRLSYTHFSPMTGEPDIAENYHTVVIDLSDRDAGVTLSLTQDGNRTENARQHAEKNWGMMLAALKKHVEQ